MKILVTGGAGFNGSCFIRYMLDKYPDYKIINLDLLTYAGNQDNLKDLYSCPNHTFIEGDISNTRLLESLFYQVDCVVNFAAESNVDKSIQNPNEFIRTNVLGTHTLLECARKFPLKRFIQISTSEVYGSVEVGKVNEKSLLAPSNPFSASKASADMLALAYYETYKIPVLITRSSNNYGPYQFPEKLIPLFVSNLMEDKKIALYGDGSNVRDWLYVYDNCSAIDMVLHRGRVGEVYNIGGSNERSNKQIADFLLNHLGKSYELLEFVSDRPTHDKRYAVDSSKIQNELGWQPLMDFETGLKYTIDWFVQNKQWIENIKRRQPHAFSKHTLEKIF